jgi:hypothetical protein
MKTATYRDTRPSLPYPNAATRREVMNKFLDNLLIAAMVVAAVTVFLFLVTLA